MRALWVAVALCAVACGESEPGALDGGDGGDELGVCEGPVDESCRPVDARDDLSGCFVGALFANCGGSGEPRLGCKAGSCRWFAGGLVPLDHDINCCPPDDLCCNSFFKSSVAEQWVDSWGVEPWTETRAANLTVVTSNQASEGDLSVSCQGSQMSPNIKAACEASYAPRPGIRPAPELDTYVLGISEKQPGTAGVAGLLEVMPGIDDGARLCFAPYTDVIHPCGACSEGAPQPTCATSGQVRISPPPWDDATLAGVVTATFADGTTMTIRF